jgi:hypothetical protein
VFLVGVENHGKVIEKTLFGEMILFRGRPVLGIVPTGGQYRTIDRTKTFELVFSLVS